jgi:FlaA1/EpsC-like NDP-sugar epimerase
MAAREMLAAPEAGYLPLAFIDDDPSKQGSTIEGLPVLGDRSQIPRLLKELGADEILIALPSLQGAVIRDVIDVCRSERVGFRIVPGIWEIIRGDVHLEQIRPIEPEDLLGRETVEPDPGTLGAIYRGRRVLVTGAGGSIGRELARQVLALEPAELILLGRGENSLFETDLALREMQSPSGSGGRPRWELALVDLRDTNALTRLFERCRPEIVLHAAAHKHVTFLESFPEEAVLNNVLATRDVIDAAATVGTDRFVMLSTDKAVYPESVLGASKRLAERLLEDRSGRSRGVRLMAVRFGNVLASRGSVVPLFRHQIRSGGPVTVSHPDASRFFMTLKEAVTLVLEAGALGHGGEIFILDMGEQIRILDLARDLIILSGLRPEIDLAIEITGLKPGEKLREEIVHAFETLEPTRNPKIRSARRTGPPPPPVEAGLARLEALARQADRAGLRALLAELLPESRFGHGRPTPAPARVRRNAS